MSTLKLFRGTDEYGLLEDALTRVINSGAYHPFVDRARIEDRLERIEETLGRMLALLYEKGLFTEIDTLKAAGIEKWGQGKDGYRIEKQDG